MNRFYFVFVFDLGMKMISTVGFVIGFSTFLLGCVDYKRIRHDQVTRLSEVVVDRCVSK